MITVLLFIIAVTESIHAKEIEQEPLPKMPVFDLPDITHDAYLPSDMHAVVNK